MGVDMILWAAMTFVRETLLRGNVTVSVSEDSRRWCYVRIDPEPESWQTRVFIGHGNLNCSGLWGHANAAWSWYWDEGVPVMRPTKRARQ